MRRDNDDPYFVVAADKGTATFSDTANAISEKHGFWLDDAFASGGSAGYDHKKMGITAKGAWEAVKRHFREMNRDIQTTPFTVVGVGDMSGDVFGNGMLLSEQTRLIAAFDHRDIFIDPDPDDGHVDGRAAAPVRPAALELAGLRQVEAFGRRHHHLAQPEIGDAAAEAAAAIGLGKTVASPAEIMNAILKAPVDLLWFGGIGTYVRATGETNQDVGDRANDAIRVTAAEVRAKVIGEGANLGVTQRARIEFGLTGGACNSDAIDNSGGVNSSDVEVNIKIALASAMRKGSLTRPARNKLLAEMTEEVGGLVLANNYQQTLALSAARRSGAADLAAPGPLHDRAGGARAARPRGRDAAFAGRACRARGARRAADARRARRAARLCQDRAVLRHRRQRRARRSAFRARPDRLFPGPHGEEVRRRDRRPPAAPRDHRARARQRSDQPRRPVLRDAAAGRERAHRARGRARLRRGARRLRAAGALSRDRSRSTTRSTARCSSTSMPRSAA